MFYSKKSPHQPACMTLHIIAAVFLFIAMVASLVGLVMAHFDASDSSLVFGTSPASLSIIAFAVTVSFLLKQCKGCMSRCDVCYPPVAAPTGKKK